MGILHDLVEAGFLTANECKEEFEDWYGDGYGYAMKHYGDVEDIEEMMLEMYEKGFDEFGDALLEDFLEAMAFYEKESGYTIYYEIDEKHWRSSVTGEYVSDPYHWIRD